MNVLSLVVNAVFPAICPCCRKNFWGLNEAACPVCRSMAYEQLHLKSLDSFEIISRLIADERTFYFNRLYYLSFYGNFEKSFLNIAKFSDNINAKSLILSRLTSDLDRQKIPEYDFIIPAPSSKNITTFFSHKLSNHLDIPVVNIFNKKKQSENKSLNKFERFFHMDKIMNLETGFKLAPDSRVLIFDDIWTTGATLNSMCRLLCQNGIDPQNIDCLVLFLRLKNQNS